MQELFQLFGELGVRTENAFRQIDNVERRVRDLARQFATDLEADITVNDQASGALEDVGTEAERTMARLQQLEEIARQVENQLEQDIAMNVDVNDADVVRARNDLQLLRREIDRLQQRLAQQMQIDAGVNPSTVPNPTQQPTSSTSTQTVNTRLNVSTNIGEAQQQVGTLQEQLRDLQSQLGNLRVNEDTTMNFNGMRTNVDGLLMSLGHVEQEMERIQSRINGINDADLDFDVTTGQAGNGSRQAEFNNLTAEMARLQQTMAALTAATVANAAGNVGPGGFGRGVAANQGYDLNRVFQQQMRMNQMMLQYAQRMNPTNAVGRAREKIDIGANIMPHLDRAQTQLELQALMGMMNSSIMTARRQLSQLGFGQTSTEVKALHAQLYQLGNVQMDNLKDQIKLTEKALKDMKSAANADELVDEIARAERSLENYKNQLKNADPFKQLARVNGLDAEKIFGKDVFVKPWKNQLDRVGGMLTEFFNKDVASLMNKSYQAIDGAAKKIVGAQTTALEQKQKIMQLQTRYQMLGQQINTFVTPAVLGLAAAFTMVGASAEEGWNKFQAQTLTGTKDMAEFKNMITDTSVATGASQAEVGELFSVLHNQLGKTKDNIEEAATMGLYFKKVWGVDAAQAVSSVDGIAKNLGVSTKQAQDILALALKKHQGDIEAATQDVMEHEKAWKEASKAGTEGAQAYSQMQEGIDAGATQAFLKSFRQMGAALLELWKQLEPTLTAIADKITVAAQKTTEWLRANPGMAKFLAHAIAIGGAVTVLIGLFAPLAGFLIMHRGLFQALAQSMGLASKGAVVLSPAVRMVMDTMKMTGNAIAGLPRVIAGVFPGLLAMLRSMPGAIAGAVVNFVKMNPLLAAMGALVWVVQKNWERFQPVLASIWDSIKRIGDAIFGAFAGPGGDAADGFGKMMDMLAKVLGDILLPVLKVVAVLVEALAVVMENGGGKFVAAAGAVWLFGGALGKVIPMFTGFQGALAAIFGPFTKLFTLLRGIGPMLAAGFARIGPLLARIPAVFALVGRGLAMLGPLLMNPWTWVVLAIAGIAVLIYKNWDKIKEVSIKALKAIGDGLIAAWNGIVSGFKAAGAGIANFFKGMWEGVKNVTSTVWNAISSFLRQHWQVILAIVTGPIGMLVLLISRNWDRIKSATQTAWNAITGFLRGAWNAIKSLATSIWSGLTGFFSRLWQGISSAARTAWNAISNFLRGLWNGLRNAARTAFNAVKSAIQAVWNGIRTATQVAWNAIRTFLSTLWNSIRNTARTVFNALRSAIQAVWNAIRTATTAVWNAIRNFLRSIWNSIKSTVTSIAGALRTALINIWNNIKARLQAITNALKNAIIAAWNAIKNFIRSAATAIKNAVVGAFNAVRNTVKSVMSAIRTAVGNAFNWMVSKAKSFGSSFAKTLKNMWNGLKDMGKQAWNWGKDIVNGLIGGIGSMVSKVAKTIGNVASTVKNGITKALGIRSPSRVMKGYGVNVGEGLEIGIRDTIAMVGKASNALAGAITPPDDINANVNVQRNVSDTITSNIASAMTPNAQSPTAGVAAATGNVTNNNTTNNNGAQGGVQIGQATFQLSFEKLPQNEQEVTRFRRAIQNVVSNDLFGMAVRNV